MQIKKSGYVLPVVIGILVVASLGLLMASWWGGQGKSSSSVNNQQTNQLGTNSNRNINTTRPPVMSDDKTLDSDMANINAQVNTLDTSNTDVTNSFSDKSSI